MTLDNVVKGANLVAWAIAIVVFYFSNQTATATDVSKANERVSILEHQMRQEVLGYNVLQGAIGQRLDRIERKVDCVIDKRLC